MQRNSREVSGEGTNGLPRNEAWSFSQALSSTPISLTLGPEAKVLAKRQQLRRLAAFSSRHAEELRDLQAAEAQSRRHREILEWAAQISTRAEVKLRALQTKEAKEREAL